MNQDSRIFFRIIVGYLIPREGSTDQVSWDHKQIILFLTKSEKVNLIAYIFHHLCEAIKNTVNKQSKNVPYVRMLLELFYQSRLIDTLKKFATSKLGEECRSIMSGGLLGYIGILAKKDVVKPEHEFRAKNEKRSYIENFTYFTKHDNP